VQSAGGEVVDPDPGSGKKRAQWLDAQLDASPVTLDREARDRVSHRLGDDIERVGALLGTLESTFGPGAHIGVEDVEPFLGEAGSVPPWELTDAIDAGDRAKALDRLHRMTAAGGMHALQVMAMLHTHYGRILRLDGEEAADDKAAAALLGMKGSSFPARKALQQCRRLGSDGVRRAVELLADADLDLRGRTAWPDQTVMEVLVARLAYLSRR
jgi:DNA polymerase-3 subunit delta